MKINFREDFDFSRLLVSWLVSLGIPYDVALGNVVGLTVRERRAIRVALMPALYNKNPRELAPADLAVGRVLLRNLAAVHTVHDC